MEVLGKLAEAFISKGSMGTEQGRDLLGDSDGVVVEFTETTESFKLKLWRFADEESNYDVEISKVDVLASDKAKEIVYALRDSMSSHHLKVELGEKDSVSSVTIDGLCVYNKQEVEEPAPQVPTQNF